MQIEVDKKKCTGCGKCDEICPKAGKIWTFKDNKAYADNLEYCHVCTLCAGACPEAAIKIIRDSYEKPKDQVE
ncbi:MAG: ferredoxin [Methanobacterium sp.]|nr:MAG: ferredoxin [Methanobacterium sp.]